MIAFAGYIEILYADKLHDEELERASSSQSTQKIQLGALTMEVLQILQRCLTQNYEIRSFLYIELTKIIRVRKELSVDVSEMMYNHIMIYYEPNLAIKPPIRLDLALHTVDGAVELVEPLPLLLQCFFEALLVNRHNYNNFADSVYFILFYFLTLFF